MNTNSPKPKKQGMILDPSLDEYLRHIRSHKKKFIQFSFKKIEEIITVELEIDIKNDSELLRRVTVHCFAYFLKNWPQWTSYTRLELAPEEGYNSLKAYMGNKLRQLKYKEKAYVVGDKYNSTALPDYSFPELNESVKIEFPYNLTIAVPAAKLSELTFSHKSKGDLAVEIKSCQASKLKFTAKNVLEYPFISVEFNIPGIVKIERNACPKVERFIQYSSVPPATDAKYNILVENVSTTAKVYTFNFFKRFFQEFSSMVEKCGCKISTDLRSEVLALFSAILADIYESNICNRTICEGAVVKYNVGGSVYYADTVIAGSSAVDGSVYRKVITPIISYSLVSCSIQQQDINKDGFQCFAFKKTKNKIAEDNFIFHVKNCLSYKCILCDTKFTSPELRLHLMTVHPVETMFTCVRCSKSVQIVTLLRTRWRHDCNKS